MDIIKFIRKSTVIQASFVLAGVLVVYMPSLFAEICKIDDLEMLSGMRTITQVDLRSIFMPHAGGGLYYRPIIFLSFLFDHFVFNLNAVWMHAHNILIHLVNTLLVFLLARQLVLPKNSNSLLPFTVSLMFGVHPLATESVNWISGRTDLLSGLFLLCAALMVCRYRENHTRLSASLAIVCIVCAVLTKEFALAFIPAVALLLTARSSKTDDYAASKQSRYRTIITIVVMALIVVSAFFLLRSVAFTSNSSRIGLSFKILFVDYIHTVTVFAGAFAFYIKKIFFPFPLNFAIMQIDSVYELLAVPLLVICIRALISRTLSSMLFLTGVLLFSPSFIIALNQIAWTPYAERYAYLSAAFILVGTSLYIEQRCAGRFDAVRHAAIVIIIVVAGSLTYLRNVTWQSNFTLMEDTVTKSPWSADARLLYGALLAERGRYDDALAEFEYGKRLPGLGNDERFDLNIAAIHVDRHRFDKAIEVLAASLKKSKGRSVTLAKELISQLHRKLNLEQDEVTRNALGKRIIALRLDIFRQTGDTAQFAALRDLAYTLGNDALYRRYSSLALKPQK